MFLNYNIFYRKYGVRRAMELFSPRIFEFNTVSLPRDVVYHHDLELDSLGPSIHDTLFLADHSKIPVDFCQYLINEELVQKRKLLILNKAFHDYVKTNDHKFVYDKTMLQTKKIKAHIALISYTPLKELYTYRTHPLTPFYEWFNLYNTAYFTLDEMAESTKRQQFIVLELPYIFPSLNMLKLHVKENNKSMLRIFDDHKKLNVLDFFRFLDPEYRHMSSLDRIKKDNYKYVNIFFKFDNLFYLCNIGQMVGYTESQEGRNPLLQVHQLQKMFLKALMTLHKTYDDLQNNEAVIQEANKEDNASNDVETEPMDLNNNNNTKPEPTPNNIIDNMSDVYVENPDSMDELNESLRTLDEDLKEIEKYSQMAYDNENVEEVNNDDKNNNEDKDIVDFSVNENTHEEVKQIIHKEKHPVDKIKEKLDHYKSKGILNNTDYKSNIRSLEKYQNMKSPYNNNVKLDDYVKVKPEELQVTHEEKQLVKPDILPDTKMAESTTNVFHDKYIKNVMNKDIASMVTNLLSSDYIVDDYQIERHDDMLGSYENHTIKVKPIHGQASTIHFKIPVVNENGELVINQKVYYLRSQRAD